MPFQNQAASPLLWNALGDTRLDFVLDAAKAAFFEIDFRHGTVVWSKGHADLFGHPPDLPPSREAWEATLHPEDRSLWLDALHRAIAAKSEEFWQEYRIVHRHRGVRSMASRSRISYDAEGRPETAAGINIDITDLVLIREALAVHRDEAVAARDLAEKASQAKSRFLAAASHDLRQPLQGLLMFHAVLAQRLSPADAAILDKANSCANTLAEIVNDLLDVAKLDAGVIPVNPTECSVDALLRNLLPNHETVASAKGLRLRHVPSRVVVRTDPTLMRRILDNLLSNAVKFTRQGGILVGCRRNGREVRIEVWDSGIGLAPDQLQVVFEEFEQIHNPERARDKGSGLGLAIVDRVARLLGVKVTVRSVVGRGSCFAVAVPAA